MKRVLLIIICLLFVTLFGYTAVQKILHYTDFAQAIQNTPLLSSFSSIAWGVPLIELLLATALCFHQFRNVALYGSFIIMLAFTGYVWYLLQYSPEVPCSCGGAIESLTWPQHLVLNSSFTLLALTGIWLQKQLHLPISKSVNQPASTSHIAIIISSLLLIAAGSCKRTYVPEKGAPLPAMKLQLVSNGNSTNTDSIKMGTPVLFMYFSPICKHCVEETDKIISGMNEFKNIQFYFISTAPLNSIQAFEKAKQLYRYSNITVVKDVESTFVKRYHPRNTPYFMLFDRNKKYITSFEGAIDLEKVNQQL